MAVSAQAQPASAQTIEAYVGAQLDNARMGPIHWRVLALVAGGAWPWPVGLLLTIYFRDTIGWRGIWIIIGIGALVIFVLRFSLPESPRWLATHGQGRRALDLLQRMGLRTVPIETLRIDAASDTKSDPIGIVFRNYPRRVIAGM